ncbi:MAG: sulfotransferase [Synechococcus sp.]
MTLPNFFIVGAAKSGTSSLYKYLASHPSIYMSPIKEPRFFAFENQSLSFAGPNGDAINASTITSLADYQNLFAGVTDEVAIGEASTAYLAVPESAERIHKYAPDAKIIAILRHPADRAYSSYLHLKRDNYEPYSDFSQALQKESHRRAQNWEFLWRYKELGFYFEQLKRYYARFDRDRIRVYLYDDLCADSTGLLKGICQFLGVNELRPEAITGRNNASGIPKNRGVYDYLVKENDPIKNIVKTFLPESIRRPIVNRLIQLSLHKPQLSPQLRHQLTQDYRDDILQVQDLIQRDLSHWLT